jgi:hypothetical protein
MTNHQRLLLAFIGMMILLGGCLRWPGPTTSPRTLALFGGQEGYELVHTPALARVELYSLAADPAAPGSARRIAGQPIASGPHALDDAALQRISDILRDEASYDWNTPPAPPASGSPPTATLRFVGARKTIDLLFCFTDNTLAVHEGDKQLSRARLAGRAGELSSLLTRTGPSTQ